MKNTPWTRCKRRMTAFLVLAITSGSFVFQGCLDSDIAKRFRTAYAPGFTDGLSTALGQAGQTEAGLRQTGVAFAEALGSVLEPRTPASGSSSTTTH
jgi:hypothetical protein